MSRVVEAEFREPSERGRVYRTSRRVHLGDVGSSGELRLEALARFLQDVATDDAIDGGLRELGGTWVLRRLAVDIVAPPRFNDRVELATFCSGWGPRLGGAPHRHDGPVPAISLARTVAIWVFIDRAGGRPLNLHDDFFEIYGDAARSRKVSARLRAPSAGAIGARSGRGRCARATSTCSTT